MHAPILSCIVPEESDLLVLPDGSWTATSTGVYKNDPNIDQTKVYGGYISTFYDGPLDYKPYHWVQIYFGGATLKVKYVTKSKCCCNYKNNFHVKYLMLDEK